jgi:hypothetical protein
MSDFYGVENMTVDFIDSNDSGNLSISSPASTKNKMSSKGTYDQATLISVSNFANNNVTNGTGSGVFSVFRSKNKTGGKFLVAEGDQATLSGTGTNKNPPPATLPFTSTVEITDGNQNKAKGV